MKWAKRILSFVLVMIMCCGMGIVTMAADKESHLPDGWRSLGLSEEQLEEINQVIQSRAPAPGLSSVTITDLAVDQNNEIHVEVQVMGTARSVLCWSNGMQCDENYNEMVSIVNGNIVVGTYRYFHTGIYYSEDVSGMSLTTSVQAINAMSPWNTLTTSRNFVLP